MPKPELKDLLKNPAAENIPADIENDSLSYHSLYSIPRQDQVIKNIPFDKCKNFFSAEIGFKPQTEDEFYELTKSD